MPILQYLNKANTLKDMAMTPQLQTLKSEYIKSVYATSSPENLKLHLPFGDDFEVVHKFYLHRNRWRISLFMVHNGSMIGIGNLGDYSDRAEALRETYRLNGWGEPKPRKCQ